MRVTKNGKRPCRSKQVFEIDIKFAWKLFLKQKRRCALTGLELHFGKHGYDKFTASLDRIDNNVGYKKNNVQWVHKDVNKMKNVFPEKYFIEMCSLITKTKGTQ
jgi:hypothetical protein